MTMAETIELETDHLKLKVPATPEGYRLIVLVLNKMAEQIKMGYELVKKLEEKE